MSSLGILEDDLAEVFTKSSGKGGQNTNKVSTAVVLKHLPTGEHVKCGIYRTQGLNRYKARVILCDRIEKKSSSNSDIGHSIAKIRKRKSDKRKKQRKKLDESWSKQNMDMDY